MHQKDRNFKHKNKWHKKVWWKIKFLNFAISVEYISETVRDKGNPSNISVRLNIINSKKKSSQLDAR